MLRSAALWLLAALLLAWCLVGMKLGLAPVKMVFQGKTSHLLQAHIDFLLMSALLFGIYAAKTPLAPHVRWSMAVGALTNPSLFLLAAIFPELDTAAPGDGLMAASFGLYRMASILITTYGFGAAAIAIFLATFTRRANCQDS